MLSSEKIEKHDATATDDPDEIPSKRMKSVAENENNSNGIIATNSTTEENAETDKPKRIPKRKFALLMGFSGSGYYGMQINKEFPTIELDLFRALRKLGVINAEEAVTPGLFDFQRAARTDKGVSAVKQVCSLKIAEPESISDFILKLNEELPEKIRVFNLIRATKGFDAKNACSHRTYAYMCPSFAFAHVDEVTSEAFRMPADRLKEIDDILSIYCGTHNFFNFTSNREHTDNSCQRYIMDCHCVPNLYVADEIEFVTIIVRGQSFMLHQIRKMIGLCIGIVRGLCDKMLIQKAWESNKRFDIPKAPGLGLLLEEVHYDHYNKRYEKTHAPMCWKSMEDEVERFRRDSILPVIVKGEKVDRSMFNWLQTLSLHTFDVGRQKYPLKDQSEIAKALELVESIKEQKNSEAAEEKNLTAESEVER